MRTKECSASVVEGRLDKASQFMDAAETIREFADEEAEIADAYVTLCVLAGIAAADVICCSRLGRHARGGSHDEAATLLASADREAVKHLQALLRMKTKAGYGHASATKDEVKKAGRAADALVEKARRARARGTTSRSASDA